MMTRRLPAERLSGWVSQLMSEGWRVVGPVNSGGMTLLATIKSPEELVLGPELTRKSPKGVFFPQSEIILKYRQGREKVEVEDVNGFARPTVLLGVHPCDAASMEILDKVFSGKYADKFYLERRRNTVVVSLGCDGMLDGDCFCTSVGLAPDSRKGADVYSQRSADGSLYLEAQTEKGEKLLAGAEGLVEPAEPLPQRSADEPLPFDLAEVKGWLDTHFDDDFWRELALRCAGCGTCAYICPTCHCFDIADETRHGGEGVRRKNWDSCQFGLFTAHASGHNPRGDQSARFRQRVMHKFKYYADNFGSTLCVGCGRCVRSCPVGQSLLEVLVEIGSKAKDKSAEKVAQ
jgi:ferredoxin